jgi:enoyl-CoA hydratase
VSKDYLTRSMVFGELFDPETAVKAGYLDQVVDAGALMATAQGYAEGLKPLCSPSLTGNKRLLREETLATIAASLPD